MGRGCMCRLLKFLSVVGFALFIVSNVLFIWIQERPQSQCTCDCERVPVQIKGCQANEPPSEDVKEEDEQSKKEEDPVLSPHDYADPDSRVHLHRLAVIVPFRNRFEELLEFGPHMRKFLDGQNMSHEIWVINQADTHRFNRAALLNVGFLLSRTSCDYLALHDVDLLPLNSDLLYSYPEDGPLHVSSPSLHPLYHYKTFVGGILLLTREQFEKVDGMSTIFWGWGREDDELYLRMKDAGMTIHYPQGITTGYKTFKHFHDKEKHPRDQKRYKNQWEVSRKRDHETGLSTLRYTVLSSIELAINGYVVNFVNVELECDYEKTPFCDHPS